MTTHTILKVVINLSYTTEFCDLNNFLPKIPSNNTEKKYSNQQKVLKLLILFVFPSGRVETEQGNYLWGPNLEVRRMQLLLPWSTLFRILSLGDQACLLCIQWSYLLCFRMLRYLFSAFLLDQTAAARPPPICEVWVIQQVQLTTFNFIGETLILIIWKTSKQWPRMLSRSNRLLWSNLQ